LIIETIVTTSAADGAVNVAPMGVEWGERAIILKPFLETATYRNVVATRSAVVNLTDDVRVFAGCLTGRTDWPTMASDLVPVPRLAGVLAHAELAVVRVTEDEQRPRFHCRVVRLVQHAPFGGFNRAQAAVIEAAILTSRLHMLPPEKIESELAYLEIAISKTAGPAELEAWDWLMEKMREYRAAPKG